MKIIKVRIKEIIIKTIKLIIKNIIKEMIKDKKNKNNKTNY